MFLADVPLASRFMALVPPVGHPAVCTVLCVVTGPLCTCASSACIAGVAPMQDMYVTVSKAWHLCESVWQAIVPSATLALYHAMAYLAGKFGHTRTWQRTGGRLHAWLLARQVRILMHHIWRALGLF